MSDNLLPPTSNEGPPPPAAGPAPSGKTGKKVVIDDRPMWKKKRFLIPAVFLLLIVGAAVAGGGGDDTSTGDVSTTAARTRTAITFDEITRRSDEQTDAQWEKFADELESDYRAEDWVGYVLDVREQVLGDDFYVQLSTDADGILPDFNKDLSEADALALSKGDRLVVSGDIQSADRIGTVTIELAK